MLLSAYKPTNSFAVNSKRYIHLPVLKIEQIAKYVLAPPMTCRIDLFFTIVFLSHGLSIMNSLRSFIFITVSDKIKIVSLEFHLALFPYN